MGVLSFIFYLVVIMMSVVIHEVAHGYAARALGDDTAERAGRLTLNPVKHLDMFGSIIFPTLMHLMRLPIIGWAKPVPYDPTKLYKDYRYGPLKVALAGPFANIAVFLCLSLAIRFLVPYTPPLTVALVAFVAFLNISLAIFNLLPIPPLDGSKILLAILPPASALSLERLGMWGIPLVMLIIYLGSGILSAITFGIFQLVVGPQVTSMMVNLI